MESGSTPFRFRKRRLHRLPYEVYSDHGSTWHVTIGAKDRPVRPFADEMLAQSIIALLDNRGRRSGVTLHLYCLMPDHLHLIMQMASGNLIDVVSELKSATTRVWWSHGGRGRLWQPSFYDHGIREAQDFEAIAAYVLENPVRAGLVEEWEDYPHIGGTMIDRGPS